MKIIVSLLVLAFFSSCNEKKGFFEKDKVFHAAPSTLGIGNLSFALYKDSRYQIINSGGIGASYYEGEFKAIGDTIILNELDKQSSFRSNRLLIIRYKDQTDSFWKWKYPDIKDNEWQLQQAKMPLETGWALGEVYQLDENNQLMRNADYFYIRLDSLKSN